MEITRKVGAGLVLLLAACGGDSPTAAPALSSVESGARPPSAETTAAAPRASGPNGWPTAARIPADAPAPDYERVVLVTIDTLRRDHVSAYGYPRPTTPFLDSLAERGVLFERAVSSMSHTAPAHATMLTGLHPLVHGVRQNGHDLDARALDAARLFGTAGFHTAAFVNVKFLEGITGSFDTFEYKLLRSAPVVNAALEWIEGSAPRRFFLWVHLYDPHHWKKDVPPVEQSIAAVRSGTELAGGELFAALARLHGIRATDEVVLGPSEDDGTGTIERVTKERFVELVDRYDGLIRNADAQLRRLYEGLEAARPKGRTLWIVTSDHGEGIASHGFAGHGGKIYQEQVAVPLVVHASDGSLGARRVPELVQHLDLFPTLAELVHAELSGFDPELEGTSLVPLLAGAEVWHPRPAFSQRRPPPKGRIDEELFALQSSTHKWIQHAGHDGELYDLAEDPLELENLLGQGLDVEASLRALLTRRLEAYRGRAQEAGDTELSDETLEELRALGYAE